MQTDDLDFHLPPDLIAQAPASERAASRLLHYRRADRSIAHRSFAELPDLLSAKDTLVFNDARVVPARFLLRKESGGRVEGLFLGQAGARRWRVLLKNLGTIKGRQELFLRFEGAADITAHVVESVRDGQHVIEVSTDQPALTLLARIGRMPLPPYIKRKKDKDERDDADRERYQTVFARADGSVAAPTAGLHFTTDMLSELDRRKVARTSVTLNVGLGTFKPISADRVEDHAMHIESYEITRAAADAINKARRDGRRLIAVGTTSARVLESQPADRPIEAKRADTGILIYPPYTWKHVGAMITNFHLPKSTLIALVAAMIGLEEQRRIYEIAIAEKYRFFSYGDAMFID